MLQTLCDKLGPNHVVRTTTSVLRRLRAVTAGSAPLFNRRNVMFRFVSVVVATAAFVLAGCNTVQGVGKDIEKGGEAIQKAVK